MGPHRPGISDENSRDISVRSTKRHVDTSFPRSLWIFMPKLTHILCFWHVQLMPSLGETAGESQAPCPTRFDSSIGIYILY